jgi:hypothetical protein
VGVDPVDPVPSKWLASTAGFGDRSGSGYMDTVVAQAATNTQFRFVPVSDGPGWAGGTGAGVIVDASSKQVVSVVRVQEFNGRLQADTATLAPLCTAQTAPLVAAASGRRQEARFFGERNAANRMVMRSLDFATKTQRIEPILEGELYAPTAATYRPQDDAYYVLDLADPVTMRLVRVERGLRAIEVGRWTVGPNTKTSRITTSNDGALVITTSTDTQSRIGIIRFTGETASGHSVFVEGIPRMIEPAFLSSGRIGLIVAPSTGARTLHSLNMANGTAATLSGMSQLFPCRSLTCACCFPWRARSAPC